MSGAALYRPLAELRANCMKTVIRACVSTTPALCWLLAALTLLPAAGLHARELLRFEVRGINGEPRRNVQAYLGAPPSSDSARRNALAVAETRIQDALRALGYYNPEIGVEVDRAQEPWTLTATIALGPPARYETVEVLLRGDAGQDVAFAQYLEAHQP